MANVVLSGQDYFQRKLDNAEKEKISKRVIENDEQTEPLNNTYLEDFWKIKESETTKKHKLCSEGLKKGECLNLLLEKHQ